MKVFHCVNLIKAEKNKVKGVLAKMNMFRKSQLTPRKSLLYDAVKIYRQKNLVVHKRYTETRTRLKMADKFINTNKKSLCGLNQFTRQFIESQIRMQPQKPRGRRFTVNDKVFALSLFKQKFPAFFFCRGNSIHRFNFSTRDSIHRF